MCRRILKFLSSLRLTVACLCAALLLVFVGTMTQVDQGLYTTQERYFRSVFVYWSPAAAGSKLPIFPGGYLVGGVLVVNLLAAHATRFKFSKAKVGMFIIHAGILLLVLGQFATDLFQVESHMRLTEGQPRDYSEDSRNSELAVIDTSPADFDEVVAIPHTQLAAEKEIRHEKLPFTIHVKHYLPNSRLARRAPMVDKDPPPATEAFGPQLKLTTAPVATKMDERNIRSAVLEISNDGKSLGSWLVSDALDDAQPLNVNGKTYQLALRSTRYYKPYSLELQKFTHEVYKGTDIPKNFASRVRLQRVGTGEDREALIYMNNPLRYGGETYYQSGFDDKDIRVSILQVVRNPGWLTPYLSCALVSLGLLTQFATHLVGFAMKRRTA
jgi:hypothetical protein